MKLKKRALCCVCIWMMAFLSGCTKPETVPSDSVLEDSVSADCMASEIQNTQTIDVDATEELEEETEAVQREYKIVMVGDVLLHTPVEESCKQEDGIYDYDTLFVHTKKETFYDRGFFFAFHI